MELMDIMKQRRETLSLTQQDLAEMSQVGLATIKDIERGKGNPALSTVKKILDILGIEIEYSIRQTV
jgi:Predicted transcriptional regulator with C-terminal CBS domains